MKPDRTGIPAYTRRDRAAPDVLGITRQGPLDRTDPHDAVILAAFGDWAASVEARIQATEATEAIRSTA